MSLICISVVTFIFFLLNARPARYRKTVHTYFSNALEDNFFAELAKSRLYCSSCGAVIEKFLGHNCLIVVSVVANTALMVISNNVP